MDTTTLRSLSHSLHLAGVRISRLRFAGRLGYIVEAHNRLGAHVTVCSGSLEGALRKLFEGVGRSMYVLGRELVSPHTSGAENYYLRCQQGHTLPDRWVFECHGCTGSLCARRAA